LTKQIADQRAKIVENENYQAQFAGLNEENNSLKEQVKIFTDKNKIRLIAINKLTEDIKAAQAEATVQKAKAEAALAEVAVQKAKAEAAQAEAAAAKSASNKPTTAELKLAETQAQLTEATKEIERINAGKTKEISDAVRVASQKQSTELLRVNKLLDKLETYKEIMKMNIVTIANIINGYKKLGQPIDTGGSRSVVAILHDIYKSVISGDLRYVFNVTSPPLWVGPETMGGGYLLDNNTKSKTRRSGQKKSRQTSRKSKL
jgi:multidrug efflux pump subunit AcrA (membrane-fusion protein)